MAAYPASYAGNQIFGRSVTSKTVLNPSAKQINEFFGISGRESIDGGTRGGVSEVTGVLVGNSIEDLGSAILLIRSYNDNIARTFVDTAGIEYDNVQFVNTEPVTGIMQDDEGNFYQQFRTTFDHLAI